MDIQKLNECLLLGLTHPESQSVIDRTFDMIADFTNNHVTDSQGYLVKEPGKKFDRKEIIEMMLGDMEKKLQVMFP